MAHTANPLDMFEQIEAESDFVSSFCRMLKIKGLTISLFFQQFSVLTQTKTIIIYHTDLLASNDAQNITTEFAEKAYTGCKGILEAYKSLYENQKKNGRAFNVFLGAEEEIISDLEEIVADYSIILDPEIDLLLQEFEEVIGGN
jgi:hypothetical protein